MREGLDVHEAQSAVLAEVRCLAPERVGAAEARGRVLAEAVHSKRALPPADCSAMDGYALRREDCAGAASRAPVRLRVVGEIPAGGGLAVTLASGEAARIFTGAPVPAGADAVVRQEDTAAGEGWVEIGVHPGEREHIRDAGEDMQAGSCVLEAGQVLGPAQLGVLASVGRNTVSVVQRARVALLSGGDELIEPDGDPSGGRIVSSNSYSLAGACRELGAEPLYLGIARDTREDVEKHLRAGLGADVLVSSAGVSVGDYDYVRETLEKLGCKLLFWGVHMKPGYPLVFGRFEDGPLVFGLPGNPVSAMVTFEQFVRPALRKLMGYQRCFRRTYPARLADSLHKRAGRLHFVRVRLSWREGTLWAHTTGNQSSGVLTSMARADGLLIFPKDATQLSEGDTAAVQILDPEFFESDASGI